MEQQKAQHDVIGSTWLQMRGFEYKVAHLVEGHVLAKRYLTGTDKTYHDLLEEDSVRTLVFQVRTHANPHHGWPIQLCF